jgi:hypothetical protein
VDPAAPSVRDVLVVTLTGRGVHGR